MRMTKGRAGLVSSPKLAVPAHVSTTSSRCVHQWMGLEASESVEHAGQVGKRLEAGRLNCALWCGRKESGRSVPRCNTMPAPPTTTYCDRGKNKRVLV